MQPRAFSMDFAEQTQKEWVSYAAFEVACGRKSAVPWKKIFGFLPLDGRLALFCSDFVISVLLRRCGNI
jgi:hypothetical protein